MKKFGFIEQLEETVLVSVVIPGLGAVSDSIPPLVCYAHLGLSTVVPSRRIFVVVLPVFYKLATHNRLFLRNRKAGVLPSTVYDP